VAVTETHDAAHARETGDGTAIEAVTGAAGSTAAAAAAAAVPVMAELTVPVMTVAVAAAAAAAAAAAGGAAASTPSRQQRRSRGRNACSAPSCATSGKALDPARTATNAFLPTDTRSLALCPGREEYE
jgi:hypothetical protein